MAVILVVLKITQVHNDTCGIIHVVLLRTITFLQRDHRYIESSPQERSLVRFGARSEFEVGGQAEEKNTMLQAAAEIVGNAGHGVAQERKQNRMALNSSVSVFNVML